MPGMQMVYFHKVKKETNASQIKSIHPEISWGAKIVIIKALISNYIGAYLFVPD